MTLAYIPSPTVSYFTIGHLTIHFYAITMLVGIVVAIWILTNRWKKMGGTFDQILDLALITVPSGLIGARIYHVITVPFAYFPAFGGSLTNIFKVWEGGMAIFGALIGGAIGAALWSRHKKYSFLLVCDALAPGLLVAQAIGRLGNWFNQELYGGPTTLPWGLRITNPTEQCGTSADSSSCLPGVYHPTFLYEMIWNLIGAAIIVFLVSRIARRLRGGQIFAIYLVWYGLGRSWIESLRINLSSEFLGIRINVWTALIAILLGLILFTVLLQYGRPRSVLVRRLQAVTAADLAREQGSDPAPETATATPTDQAGQAKADTSALPADPLAGAEGAPSTELEDKSAGEGGQSAADQSAADPQTAR